MNLTQRRKGAKKFFPENILFVLRAFAPLRETCLQ
jgi:hypothetical protein